MSALKTPDAISFQNRPKVNLATKNLSIAPGEELALSKDVASDISIYVQSGDGQVLNWKGEMFRVSSGSMIDIPAGVDYGVWNEHMRNDLELVIVHSNATSLPREDHFKITK